MLSVTVILNFFRVLGPGRPFGTNVLRGLVPLKLKWEFWLPHLSHTHTQPDALQMWVHVHTLSHTHNKRVHIQSTHTHRWKWLLLAKNQPVHVKNILAADNWKMCEDGTWCVRSKRRQQLQHNISWLLLAQRLCNTIGTERRRQNLGPFPRWLC